MGTRWQPTGISDDGEGGFFNDDGNLPWPKLEDATHCGAQQDKDRQQEPSRSPWSGGRVMSRWAVGERLERPKN